MDSTDANDGMISIGGGINAKELDHALMVEMASTAGLDLGSEAVSDDQITPLLTQQPEKPRLDIFSVSYPKRKTNKVIFIYFMPK